MDFKRRYGRGRAIAAPQIGVMKRLVCMRIDEPLAFINPVLTMKSVDQKRLNALCSKAIRLLRRSPCLNGPLAHEATRR
ncbi:MAG: hypothetical protein AB1700_03230 [Bacillota bacterium]